MEGKRATYSREDFLAVFKDVHRELIEELPRDFEMPPDAVNWVDKVRASCQRAPLRPDSCSPLPRPPCVFSILCKSITNANVL
jgi:hypothetical protein